MARGLFFHDEVEQTCRLSLAHHPIFPLSTKCTCTRIDLFVMCSLHVFTRMYTTPPTLLTCSVYTCSTYYHSHRHNHTHTSSLLCPTPSNKDLQSVAQTRHHFQNIQLGLPSEDVILKEEYEVPSEQRVKRDDAGATVYGSPARGSPIRSAKGKEKDKGKRRVVSSGL